jgi:PAS domain S-box-containing protein
MENYLKMITGENQNLFNNVPCGYHSIDDYGYLIDINNTLLQWLGYERDEVLGKLKFTDLIDKKDIPLFEKKFPLFKEKGSTSKVECNLIKKNGVSFPVVLSVVAMEDEKAGYHKSVYSTLDNTECKQALEKVNNLNQELEAFSYSVSHDLRAPLRSIDGYSRILQEDYGDKLDEEGRRVLNVIMSNAKRMGKLIDDLLDFARLGRKDIQRSRINMTGLVNNIVRELLVQEPDRKIDVKVDELDTAFADADMIRQVWLNLIENAIKYTGKKDFATIEISSYDSGHGELCYKVKDNGVGFDMKYAPKLFGVFQRLHKMQDFTGTGVGLAIVKRIITRHEGRVWAEGTLQKGATFYFTIPIDNEST